MGEGAKASSAAFEALKKDQRLIKLLSRMVSKGISEVEPKVGCDGFSYDLVKEALNLDGGQAKALLDHYASINVFRKSLRDQLLRCTKCESHFVHARLYCPFCNSMSVEKSFLIEHYACGALRKREDFITASGSLKCPVCGRELKEAGVDYRYAGAWFSCSDCKRQFNAPVAKFICRKCGAELSIDEVEISLVHVYVAEESVVKLVSKEISLISPLSDFLRQLGLESSSPGSVAGRSGVAHSFDLVARAAGKSPSPLLAIDVSKSAEGASELEAIAMFAKIADADVSTPVLVAMPRMSDTGKRLASTYGINVIEAGSLDELFAKLKELLAKVGFKTS